MSGALYLVGTPIGNLGAFSPRAVEVLQEVDFIAAEDTRVSLKLLNHFGIKKPLVSYYEHNKNMSGEKILSRLLSGETCALVTDAGMPAISDPGEDIVRMCAQHGIDVFVVPGPSAVVSALAVSGLPTTRWCFEGFLSVNKKERIPHLESLQNEMRTMIFYEAPHKLAQTLRALANALGNREIAIVREITKIHDQVIRTFLCDAAEKYSEEALKGEIVLIINGAPEQEKENLSLEQAAEYAKELVHGGESKSDAAKIAAKEFGYKKGDIYKLLLEED